MIENLCNSGLCLSITSNIALGCLFTTASLLLRKYHGGHVVIRLALGGATNRPFYRIVAAYNKRARDGKYIEQLGSYDPLPNIYNEKLVSFNYDRIKYWMGCGAHPTKPVAKLLGQCVFLGNIFIPEMATFKWFIFAFQDWLDFSRCTLWR